MKKIYEAPALILTELRTRSFLDVSGEALGEDIFDGEFGKQFDTYS